MKKIFGLLKLKLKHPSATIYIRKFPDEQKKVYYDFNNCTIWYCQAANEIIIETNSF